MEVGEQNSGKVFITKTNKCRDYLVLVDFWWEKGEKKTLDFWDVFFFFSSIFDFFGGRNFILCYFEKLKLTTMRKNEEFWPIRVVRKVN